MSLLTRKISFLTFKIDEAPSIDSILKGFADFKIRDITNTGEVIANFYTSIFNSNSNNILREGNIVAFSVRTDKKSIPPKFIKKALKEAVDEFIEMNKKSPSKEEKQNIKLEIIQELAKGQMPRESTIDIILDFNNLVGYIEYKGNSTYAQLGYLFLIHKIKTTPLIASLVAKQEIKEEFLTWLYTSLSADEDKMGQYELSLSNKIKLQDNYNEFQIKGSILKFAPVFRDHLSNGVVKECQISVKSEKTNKELSYSILDDFAIKDFTSSDEDLGEDPKELLMGRIESLADFTDHIIDIFTIFRTKKV
jgi:DNA recombination-dependent growth factor C